jgi:hypothetical protein
VPDELENSTFIDETPFNFFYINKGCTRGRVQHNRNDQHSGKFKGLIRVNYMNELEKLKQRIFEKRKKR